MSKRFDMVIIGAGPGGYVAAIRAAQLGQKVALIEKRAALGGTCLNIGCIPSKVLLDSTEFYHKSRHEAASHGIVFQDLRFDLGALMRRKNRIVSKLTGGLNDIMAHNNISVFQGTASLTEQKRVQVQGDRTNETLEASHIIIATGSIPQELPALPFDGHAIVSSTEALTLKEIPKRLLVVGGGAIGLELGSVWLRLGSEVTVCELQSHILPTGDAQVSRTMQRLLEMQGMRFLLSTAVQGAAQQDKSLRVKLQSAHKNGAGKTQEIMVDTILVAVGRRPYIEGLGLEHWGTDWRDQQGRIQVNQRFETNLKGIYAIGDAIAGPMLAHKAEEDGIAVAEQIVNGNGRVNYHTVPNVVYTWPEVASVGESESQLKARQQSYRVGRFPFAANGRAMAMNAELGFVKILAHPENDRILGVHIVGPWASALISEAVTLMEFEGCAEDLARTVHAHPTLTEVAREAALNIERQSLHLVNQ